MVAVDALSRLIADQDSARKRRDAALLAGQFGASTGGGVRVRPGSRPNMAAPPGVQGGSVPVDANGIIDVTRLPASSGSSGDDGGIDLGGIASTLGRGILRAINVPGDIVRSGVKEAVDTVYGSFLGNWMDQAMGRSDAERQADLARMGTGSINDFWNQAKNGISFRDIMDVTSPETKGKGGLYSVLGFAGDIATDPLTYVAAPLASQSRKLVARATEGALAEAIGQGTGKALAKQLSADALKAGVRSEAIDRLIVDAAERGYGAITEAGLKRAGVSTAERAALGLKESAPKLPGRILEAWENAKGSLKAGIKTRPAANYGRGLFMSKVAGERGAMMTLMNRSLPLAQRAEAAAVLTTVNTSKEAGRRWGIETLMRIQKDWSDTVLKMDDETAVALTHSVESGAVDEVGAAVQAEFENLYNKLEAAGVEVGHLRNYVPHQLTDEWRKLAEAGDEDAQRIIANMFTEQGFQKARSTENTFMGEQLVDGTIKEYNDISMRLKGVKVFHDDIREIMPRYIEQSANAIAQAKQIDMLVEAGVARPLASKTVKELVEKGRLGPIDKKLGKIVQDFKKVEGERIIQLKSGITIRKKELSEGLAGVRAERAKVAARIADVEHQVVAANRDFHGKVLDLWRTQDELDAAIQARDLLVTQLDGVPKARKAARAKLQRQVDKLNGTIVAAQNKIETNRDLMRQLAELNISPRTFAERSAPIVADTRTLQGEIGGLRSQVDELNGQIDELRLAKNPVGEGPLPAEVRVQEANLYAEQLVLERDRLMDAADAAGNVFTFVQADAKWTIESLNKLDAELAQLEKQIVDARKLSMAKDKLIDTRDTLRTVVNTTRDVLSREGNDAVTKVMATLEAQAAVADMAAWKSGNQLAKLGDMIKALEDSRFVDKVVTSVDRGMRQVGDTYQIPEWLAEATKTEWVKNQLPFIGDFMNKYMNLWKGYAIARPGFHVRNMYSGMFNIYLEAGAGAFKSARKFHQFVDLVEQFPDPEVYMEKAVAQFGARDAELLQQAWGTVAATGAGQTAGEFSQSALKKGSLNPFSEQNVILKANRKFGEGVEVRLRGTHAYDVLARGGNLDQAIDVVTKYHFNYTDITDFDRKMKLINAFWVFYSRNLALQSTTWVRNAGRLNRAYNNFARNVSYGEDEDTMVPDYFGEAGAIRLPFGGSDAGNVPYLFPDLPAAGFPGQVDNMLDWRSGKILADTAPWIKVPFQGIAGKEFFSGAPLDVNGQPRMEQAGTTMQLLDRLLPGAQTDPSARGPMANAYYQGSLVDLIPGLAQLDRMAPALNTLIPGGNPIPTSQKAQARSYYPALSFLTGLSVQENTDASRLSESLRRARERG